VQEYLLALGEGWCGAHDKVSCSPSQTRDAAAVAQWCGDARVCSSTSTTNADPGLAEVARMWSDSMLTPRSGSSWDKGNRSPLVKVRCQIRRHVRLRTRVRLIQSVLPTYCSQVPDD
jgi:hypothetical protein